MTRADAPRVIVCEPTPRWAVLLRRFAPELQVSEARSLALADDMLQAMPDGVIAVAVAGGSAADVLLRFSLWQRAYPECVTAALLDDADEDLEQALRESGAQLIVYSLFELPQLARLAQRLRAMRRLRSARQDSRSLCGSRAASPIR